MAEVRLEEAVRIEPLALEEEFVRLPGDLSYWNQLYADAYQSWLEAKLGRETMYAKKYMEHKTYLLSTTKGRVTESEVESAVLTDDAYINAKTHEIQTESDKIRLYGIMDAIRSKRDMLISIGAQHRAEMQNDPSIRRQAALAREVDNARHGDHS